MTQEEKQLLLIDLCGRLPYPETWVRFEDKDYIITGYGHGRVSLLPSVFSSVVGPCPLLEEIRPYLRSISNMTEKEKDEYDRLVMCNASWIVDGWLNVSHFDYRGLIERGLALEAPKNMYKTE